MAMIVIDRLSKEPVYGQIARQIRDLVVSGELPPGSTLPAVRVLASDLGVNLNTIARAYWLLEEEGFVRIRDRSGVAVLAPAPKPAPNREVLCRDLRKILSLLRQAGFSVDELQQLVEKEIASFGRSS
jgi:GntR family transcriptional regulator